MYEERQRTRNWIIYGMISAILGVVAYAIALAPVPEALARVPAFAIGPLLSLAFVGFYHFFRLHHKTMLLQAATLYGIIAGTAINLMIVVQSAIHMTVPIEARAELQLAYDGLNAVQLALDVSWDIYLSLATVLLGVVMLSHPRFGLIWAAGAILIGGGLLLLNLATFPIPPAEAHSFDLGPVSGVFYLIAAIRVLSSLKWVGEHSNATSRSPGHDGGRRGAW